MINHTSGYSSIHKDLKSIKIATYSETEELEYKLSNYLNGSPSTYQEENNKVHADVSGNILITKNKYTDKLQDIIYYELYKGRWENVPMIRFVQSVLSGDDPFIFTKTAMPATDRDQWPDEDESEILSANSRDIEARLLRHIKAGLDQDTVVIGAEIHVFTRSKDISFIYSLAVKFSGANIIDPVEGQNTFYGRSSTVYDEDRFDPSEWYEYDPPSFQMTLKAGGHYRLIHQDIWCYPSVLWQKRLGWAPSPNNPLIWIVDGKPSVKFEFIVGPVKRMFPRDKYYRQPMMQRWLCDKAVLEEAENKLGGKLLPYSKLDVKKIDYE